MVKNSAVALNLQCSGVTIIKQVKLLKNIKGGKIMQITDIRVRTVQGDEKLKGVASITIDDCFVVHDLRIIQGNEQLFVAMPSRRTKDGEFKDIAHPIRPEVRNEISSLVLKAFEEQSEK